METTPDLLLLDQYRRKSYDWLGIICQILYGRPPSLNARYWDQLFDPTVMPPVILDVLGKENKRMGGIVENYIYGHVLNKVSSILRISNQVRSCSPDEFDLGGFLDQFERDPGFRRSVDKVYEIVVYALFNTGVVSILR